MPEAMRQGVDALSGFGIDPREAMQMIGPIGRLGTAMKVDIADGAAAASANLQNLKVGLGDTGKALDIMAAGGNVGAFEVRDMARYFPSLTAQAQALGQSGLGAVADLTAALEIARRGAGTSEEAATNITNLLAKINSPTVTRALPRTSASTCPPRSRPPMPRARPRWRLWPRSPKRPPAATCRSWAWWSRTCRPSRPCAP
jgi:hypothetical protein